MKQKMAFIIVTSIAIIIYKGSEPLPGYNELDSALTRRIQRERLPTRRFVAQASKGNCHGSKCKQNSGL